MDLHLAMLRYKMIRDTELFLESRLSEPEPKLTSKLLRPPSDRLYLYRLRAERQWNAPGGRFGLRGDPVTIASLAAGESQLSCEAVCE